MDIQRSLEHSDASHDDIDLGTQPFDESEIRYVEGEDPVKEMMRLTNNLYIKFPGGFARTLSQTKDGLPDDIANTTCHDLAVKIEGPTAMRGKNSPRFWEETAVEFWEELDRTTAELGISGEMITERNRQLSRGSRHGLLTDEQRVIASELLQDILKIYKAMREKGYSAHDLRV